MLAPVLALVLALVPLLAPYYVIPIADVFRFIQA